MTKKKSSGVRFTFGECNPNALKDMTTESNENWIIGEPGGPAGPFYSVVSQSGRVIAMMIPDKKVAELLIEINNAAVGENAPDKLVKYGEIMQLLNNEQDWCIKHAKEAPSQEFLRGFLDGLDQAKHLLTALAHLEESNPKPGWMGDYGGPGCDPVDC